ncbi:BA14K family protein [Brucella rhizosphaerae]|uniref:Lectin-like protein BA14k n=1 Tax=Brucella rhizosphaerae TaxID=571254 RepID=A0A256F4N3_9HYPH|nr:BA14K family protein [Brucella rhizosphaerae]OYR09819.1 lectin-like protein BA14k [Brucella rhizosphaerae]
MKRLASSLLAACLALGFGMPAATSANAAQPSALIAPTTTSGVTAPVENVQYYEYRGDRRDWRRPAPRYRDGYRHYRPHYRPHWGPPPVYRHPPRYRSAPMYRGGNAHVRWCYNRYRSYRAYDNTFQPNYGPRRQCYSPYI